jgi:hypothetical protein
MRWEAEIPAEHDLAFVGAVLLSVADFEHVGSETTRGSLSTHPASDDAGFRSDQDETKIMESKQWLRLLVSPEPPWSEAARGRAGQTPLHLFQHLTYQDLAVDHAPQWEGQSGKSQTLSPRHFVFGTRLPLKPCPNVYTAADAGSEMIFAKLSNIEQTRCRRRCLNPGSTFEEWKPWVRSATRGLKIERPTLCC